MIWCVEQAELEQDVPETIADALLRLGEEEEVEKKRLEQIPHPPSPRQGWILLRLEVLTT